MANHEKKDYADSLDVYMALSRTKDGQKSGCIRIVVKNPEVDMAMLEYKVKLIGGKWRIHKTVNKRDTEKARRWLLKKLIDFPEGRGFVDALWRTALLQPECIYGDKKFLLDVDIKDKDTLIVIRSMIGSNLIEEIETENGWHMITRPFDTRGVCKLGCVDRIPDGYIYVKTVNEENCTCVMPVWAVGDLTHCARCKNLLP